MQKSPPSWGTLFLQATASIHTKGDKIMKQNFEELDFYATNFGPQITNIAYEAISNACATVGFKRPDNQSSICLPEGLTCYLRNRNIGFCYRVDLAENLSIPRRNACERLAQEFNAVSQFYSFPFIFRVYLQWYGTRQMMVVAEPFINRRMMP